MLERISILAFSLVLIVGGHALPALPTQASGLTAEIPVACNPNVRRCL